MKQIYVLIILSFFAVNIMAQEVLDYEVTQKSEDAGVTWVNSYKYEYFYETNTQPTARLFYQWNTESESWVINYKYEFTYDDNGYPLTQLTSSYDINTSSYTLKYKNEYNYDANGYQTKFANFSSDDGGTTWVGSSIINKWIKTFDNNGNLLSNAQYSWDATAGAYVANSKTEYSFDTNSNQTSDAIFTWDTESSVWVGKSGTMKTVHSYDNKNNLLTTDQYGWGGSAWDILLTQRKTTYKFDENENVIAANDSTYDVNTSSWIEDTEKIYKYELNYIGSQLTERVAFRGVGLEFVAIFKYAYDYDTEGNVIAINEYQPMDPAGTNWRWMNEKNYAFDTNGNKTLEENYKLQFTTGDKIGDGNKYVYAYDDFGNETLNEEYIWNLTDSMWIGRSSSFSPIPYKNIYEYNATGDLKTSYSGYIWDASGDWVIYSRTSYTTKDLPTDINENKFESGVHVFPNPTNGSLIIDNVQPNTHVAVYSLVGVLIKEYYPQKSRVSLDITDQPAGIYMIVAGNNAYKIIKK